MSTTIYGIKPTQSSISSLKDIKNLKYVGVKLPVGSGNKLFSKSSDNEVLIGQVRQLVYTTPGERVMLPNFGLDLTRYLFEPITKEIVDEIKEKMYTQFSKYIENAEILKIVCYSESGEDPFSPVKLPSIILRMSVKNKITNQVLPMEFKA